MPRRQIPAREDNTFQNAIAQWRLDVRTEVKRASSLPTAMFDACDPMLEMRLAETAEAMLACLQEPAPALAQPTTPAAEKRIELVIPAELQRLPGQIAAGPAATPDLDAGLDTEFLGALADASTMASGDAQANALELLANEFQREPGVEIEALAQQLQQRIQHTLSGPANDDAEAAQVAAICRRIVEAVTTLREGPPQ